MGRADGPRRRFAKAEEADLPLLLQPRHLADRLLDRHVRVDAVLVVEVDRLDPEPLQARFAGASGHNRDRRARPGTRRSGPRTLPNLVARNTSSRRSRIARADQLLVAPAPYMSAVSRKVTPRSSAWWIVAIDSARRCRAVELAHAHAAEADGGDLRAVAAEPRACRISETCGFSSINPCAPVRRAFAAPCSRAS